MSRAGQKSDTRRRMSRVVSDQPCRDGKIARIEEYADTLKAARIFQWVRVELDYFQSDVARHQIEIGIVMHELEPMLYTERTDQYVYGLTHSHTL